MPLIKSVYALHDIFDGNKVVCTGDSRTCAEFAGVSPQNICQCYRRQFTVAKRYKVGKVGEAPVLVPKHYRHKKQKERYSILNAVMMQDVIKLRNTTPTGAKVKVFEYVEALDEKKLVGVFPISEKYRHVFTVRAKGYNMSFSWTDLFRKDGVELDK